MNMISQGNHHFVFYLTLFLITSWLIEMLSLAAILNVAIFFFKMSSIFKMATVLL